MDFSDFIFDLKRLQLIKKGKKRFISARGQVDATWHSRPRGSATRAHAAPTWRRYNYIHIIYSIYRGIQLSVDRKGIQTP